MKTTIKDVLKLVAETEFGVEPSNPNYVNFHFVNDGSVDLPEGLKDEKGVGGTVFYYSLIEPALDFSGLLCSDDLNLFASLFPSINLTPQSFTVIAGNSDLGFGVKLLGSIPTEISLECKAGEAVKYSVKMNAMKVTPVTSVPTPPTVNRTGILVWHDGVVTINGSNYQVSEFKLSHKQPIKLEADLSPKPAGSKRVRNLVAWGLPEIELSCKVYLPFPTDIAADAPSLVDATIVIGGLTINLNDLFIVKRGFPVKGGDDLWLMDLDLRGYEGCMTITVE